MNTPLVTIICLCYNHARFVKDAIQSVLHQTYKNIQLIVVDDASTDNSVLVIHEAIGENPEIIFISLDKNEGNCKAFNHGLAKVRGEFVIDLAADDVLLPDRVSVGIEHYGKVSAQYGVQFSDAEIIDEAGQHLSFHSDRFTHDVPQGDIYKDLISKYFVNGPTMMIRKEVFDRLGGYDESLAYEDFDFWIRSSREFNYFYIPQVLVKKRIVQGSMSKNQFVRYSAQRKSTFEVCKKILTLNRSKAEQQSLNTRIRYEIRTSLKLFDFAPAIRYVQLLMKNSKQKYQS